MTTLEASVIHRVLSRIEEIGFRVSGIPGRERDAASLYRLLGALEAQLFPYTRYDDRSPLFDPRFERCKECGHYLEEHENGRCNHFSTADIGRDTICSCTGLPTHSVDGQALDYSNEYGRQFQATHEHGPMGMQLKAR
jgi:hypothetical protein